MGSGRVERMSAVDTSILRTIRGIMNTLQQNRMQRLGSMIEWRLRPDASHNQVAEAEAISWALEIIDKYFNENESESN